MRKGVKCECGVESVMYRKGEVVSVNLGESRSTAEGCKDLMMGSVRGDARMKEMVYAGVRKEMPSLAEVFDPPVLPPHGVIEIHIDDILSLVSYVSMSELTRRHATEHEMYI
jgi:hypothetical protein